MQGAAVTSSPRSPTTARPLPRARAQSLDEMLSLLNSQSGDRYLFSGRATDTPAVAATERHLNGVGAQAGLKQLIAERKQADVGSGGLGRLTLTAPTATSISLAEDAAPSVRPEARMRSPRR